VALRVTGLEALVLEVEPCDLPPAHAAHAADGSDDCEATEGAESQRGREDQVERPALAADDARPVEDGIQQRDRRRTDEKEEAAHDEVGGALLADLVEGPSVHELHLCVPFLA